MKSDERIITLLKSGRLITDPINGIVYSNSNWSPKNPIGHKNTVGYIQISVWVDGKILQFFAHRIIYISVHGIPPKGFHVDHLNMNRADNRISNLEAVTPQVNMQRAWDSGKFDYRRGTRSSHGTLSRYSYGCRCNKCRKAISKYRSAPERLKKHREHCAKYRNTEKGKLTELVYRQSPERRKRRKIYNARYNAKKKELPIPSLN